VSPSGAKATHFLTMPLSAIGPTTKVRQGLWNRCYRLDIARSDTSALVISIEAQSGLRSGLMALCPAGLLLVGLPALVWATVVEPPSHWAAYPLILALAAFLIWLGVAHVAMNLLQGFWGSTRLELDGERLSRRVTWCGKVWFDRQYRIGPETKVDSHLPAWFGVLVRGLVAEQPKSWWQRLVLLAGPNHALSFGAALSAADAQRVAGCIAGDLHAASPNGRELGVSAIGQRSRRTRSWGRASRPNQELHPDCGGIK
jgi:hypothetical protein